MRGLLPLGRRAGLTPAHICAGTGWDGARRLEANVPSLFWLWSPNPILAMFNLSRVQLPAYAPACFAAVPIRAPSLVASICAPSLHLRAHGGVRGGR